MLQITSLENDRVRRVLALQRSTRRRMSDGLIVIEGVRLTRELLRTPMPILEAFCTTAFAESLPGREMLAALQRRGACYLVSDDLLTAMSDTETPQGILVVLPAPALAVPESCPFCLVLDGLREPGNVGVILRTAWAAGVSLALLAPGAVDPFNPKVLRSGMGAHFFLPLQRSPWAEIERLPGDRPIWLAEAGAGVPYDAVDWTGSVALIVGGEASGAASEGRQLARDRFVSIPMARDVDSLNVGAAAAIILFEIARQRRLLGARAR